LTEQAHNDRPAIPLEVVEWLVETYTAEGVMTWLRVYESATPERRDELTLMARISPMGT